MRKSIYAPAVVFLLLLAVGCDTATGPEARSGSHQKGRVAVSLAITGTGARSVSPTLPEVATWRLQGEKTGGSQTAFTELFSNPDAQILYLEIGEWDFTLEGYEDESGEIPMLRGTITDQTISLEGSNTLEFTVAPIMEGTGTVKITIKLPSGHGIDWIEVFKGNNNEPEPKPPITFEGDTIVFTNDYTVGDYYFSFRLYRENPDEEGDYLLYGALSELVKVRQNLTSEATYTLGKEDLNLRYVITYHLKYGEPGQDTIFGYYRYTDSGRLMEPNRLGYEFKGWHANKEWDEDDDPVTEIPPATSASTGDREFYAEWKITTYYISYQPNVEGINYGDENPPDYTVEELPLTLVDPPESGDFYFDGWYDDAGCNNPADTTITTENLGSKTFHAKWKPRAPIAPIQLQALPSNPQLESVTVTVGDGNPPTFEVDTEYTDATYAWYWDGELIDEEIEASYTLANYGLPDVGTHELSVVVSAEGGRKLSARCLVAIMAEQGDEE